MIPALPEVQAYAARILAAIDALDYSRLRADKDESDRRRVERDVEGLRDCYGDWGGKDGSRYYLLSEHGDHALRYWTDLTEVGALYGQPWEDVPTIDLFLPPVGEVQP